MHTRARIALAAWLLLALACGRGGGLGAADRIAVQRAALATLFLEREHARQLVLWRGARRDAPTLGLLGGADAPGDSLALEAPDPARLGLAVPVRVVGEAALEALFRAHPDGWAAFYARYPGSAGVVEVTRVRADGPGGAWVVVGRACGEHCRTAWRVWVRRGAGGWATEAVTPVRLPRS